MKHITLITGGQRSGKSSYAERLALELSANPIYMATAHIWDEEFRQRVRVHQERRGPEWTNIEEEKYLSRYNVAGRVVLIDCCTLWATNFFFSIADQASEEQAENSKQASEEQAEKASEEKAQQLPNVDKILQLMKEEFDRFTAQDATFVFVTNEIGLGGTSANAVQRRFTDLLGWFNQYVAQQADEVFLMVSGIRMKIKG